jgi:hypothetical protein
MLDGGGGDAPSAPPSSATEGRWDGADEEARLPRRESEAEGRRAAGLAQARGCDALLEAEGPSPDEPIVVLLKRLGKGFWTTPPLRGEEELRSSGIEQQDCEEGCKAESGSKAVAREMAVGKARGDGRRAGWPVSVGRSRRCRSVPICAFQPLNDRPPLHDTTGTL